MIVFNTFLKVIKKYKSTVLLYTIILIAFGAFNMQTSDYSTTFVNTKPDVFIINEDENKGITKNLIHYIEKHCNIVNIKQEEDAINDALFYRDVNYIIYIPKNYRQDILNKKNPTINIKSTKDYQASLAEMLLTRYIKTQNIYVKSFDQEDKIIQNINNTLSDQTEVNITSQLDTGKTEKATFFFNFASYSIMAAIIFVICLVLSSFHERNVKKRIIISSMNQSKHNFQLLLSSFIYSFIIWILYMILAIILIGDIIFTARGVLYGINLLVFSFCSLTIALLISTIVHNKEALNGIVNVIALGSSFLCGVFVPTEWLPSFVLTIAHVLPTYWYVNSNDLLKTIEVINIETIKPIMINMLVLIGFSILFIILNNIITKRKQKIG